MKIKKSPLQLASFHLLELELKCIFPDDEKKKISIQSEFDAYNIDLDFVWKRNKTDKSKFMVMTKVSINRNENPRSGYSIFIEGASNFTILPGHENDEANLIQFSATGIAFQNLRDVLKNVTQNSPFGRYILPTLEMKSLVDEKINQQKVKKVKSK